MIQQLRKSEEGEKWVPYVQDFFRSRQFEVEWDGIVRGKWRTHMGAPQRSPLSPLTFLMWMAPIIEKIEEEARRVWHTLEL